MLFEYIPATNNIDVFFLQILMNVWPSLLVIRMLCAPTHLGPTHVRATRGSVEMERLVMVRM